MDDRLVRIHCLGRAAEDDGTNIDDHDIVGKLQHPATPTRLPTRR